MEKIDKLLIGKEAALTLAALAREATQSIRLMSFVATCPSPASHVTYSALWQRLAAAPTRTVDCRALFAAATPDSSQGITNRRAAKLLTDTGWRCRTGAGGRIAHSKIWIFDDHAAIIGSHNLTEAGMLRNVEVSVLIRQHSIITRLSALFEECWSKAPPA